MGKLALLGLTLALSFHILSCAPGNCRRKTKEIPIHPDQKELIKGNAPKLLTEEEKKQRVWVYKYDGSLQCNLGRKISVAEMAKELSGVKIYSQKNKHDGLMHIQACGTTTGRANVYQIHRKDLKKALAKGFQEWKFT